MNKKLPVAMTIAGSDSGGGAGIQADIKTFQALGVFGTSAITGITAQNTGQVKEVFLLDPKLVAAQIEAIMEDMAPEAVKTGMLGSADIIEAITEKLEQFNVKQLVIDPVMIATSGGRLFDCSAIEVLKTRLLPKALIVTPNLEEAGVLVGAPVYSRREMEEAARIIRDLGPHFVIIKGGHRRRDADDLIFDGEKMEYLRSPRLIKGRIHGTGCTFSAAIAALLARGVAPRDAVAEAKLFMIKVLNSPLSPGYGAMVPNLSLSL